MLSLERSRAHSLVHRIMSKQAAVRLNQQGIDLPPCQYITLIISVTKQPDWNHEINKFSERKQWIIAFLTAVGNLWFSIFNPLFDFHWNWNAQATSASNACEGKEDMKGLGWNPYAMELRQTTQHTKKESKKKSKQNKINLRVQMNHRYRFLALTICPLQVRTQNIFVLLLPNDHTHSIHSHDFSLFDLDTLYKLLCGVWNGHLTKTMINKLLTNKKANNCMQINKSRNCVECKRLWSHSFTPSEQYSYGVSIACI